MTVILHVTEKLERHGGTPRKLLYLVQHGDPAQRQCFVTFVPGNLDEDMRAAGAIVMCANSTNVIDIVRTVLACARQQRAQVICTHFTRALACGVTAGKILGLPVIHSAHGPVCDVPPPHLLGKVGRLATHLSMPGTTLVTANSQYTAASLQKVFRIPDRKIRVIPCPVAPRPRNGGATGIPPRTKDTLRLVQTGGLIPIRRQHVLLEGLAQQVHAGVNADLLLVGDGPRRSELTQLARTLAITERVHWLGFRDDVGDVLAAADVYVSAIDKEGFGIAVVEAMLQDLPVVLANGGAHPELTENGRHGVLFEAHESGALARAVAELWRDVARRTELAASAKAHATRSYTPQRYAQLFRACIDNVWQT
jgi:glycosyltransferase involved in cell wall biosynthesis